MQDVAEALVEYISRVELLEIITDRGSNFTSQLMLELYAMLGISAIKTSANHTKTVGMIVRYNTACNSGLRK